MINHLHIILSSGSPRRSQLLGEADLSFTVKPSHIDEQVPEHIELRMAPEYLAHQKALACPHPCQPNELVLAADTSVFIDHQILNKPSDKAEAVAMLQSLSDKKHEVITGFCLLQDSKCHLESVSSLVTLDPLSTAEIEYYIDHYKPFDKAGGYGIQDWIGWCKISHIEGSYSNILGLPMREVYLALQQF